MKKILFLLIASLFSTCLMAVDDVETISAENVKAKKGDDTALRGQSQGLGYNLKFGDNEHANIHFWGLTRFYAYPSDSETKLVMPYFRFNIDATKDSKWSMHARLDYGQWVKGQYFKINNEKPTDKLSGAPTIYYARAYLGFKFNQNIQLVAGRMLNQAIKYDTFDKFTAFDYDATGIFAQSKSYTDSSYQSGEGLGLNFNYDNFYAKTMVTYINGTDETEQFFYSAYAGHKVKFSPTASIDYGVGAATTSNDEANPQFVEVNPDIGIFIGDFYLANQMMVRDLVAKRHSQILVSDYKLLVRNHLEAGVTVDLMGTSTVFDTFLSSTKYAGETIHNVGVESEFKFSDSLQLLLHTEYPNITDSQVEMPHQKDGIQRLNYHAYVNYYF